MKGVLRYDASTLGKPKRMANGWVRADAYFTRTGVFTYYNADGSARRELRLPEEVFAPESLESFSLVPITNNHPPVALDASNAREYQRGTTGEAVRRDGSRVRGSIQVVDRETIAALDAGKTQLSCGYSCDVEMKPGVYEGQHYDGIQRNIRGNHVAIVDVGRAGPECAARMDAADAALEIAALEAHDLHDVNPSRKLNCVDSQEKKTDPARSMLIMDETLVKFDGVEHKLPAAVAKAIETERAALKAACDKECARADAADAKAKAATDEVAAVKASIPAAVKARVGLEVTARKFLGETVKLDGSDREVKLAVLEKLGQKVPADKSDAYVDARFDVATEGKAPALEALAEAVAKADGVVEDAEEAAKARQKQDAKLAYLKLGKKE